MDGINEMYWLTKTLFMSLSFLGFGSYVYLLFNKKRDQLRAENETLYIKSSVVEMVVPRPSIGNVVGRGGRKIRDIEIMTGTRMFFRESRYLRDVKICVIRGPPDGVDAAERLVHDSILTYPDVNTIEIFVPIRICCLLVGRFGESIQWVKRLTRAKVILDNWCFHNNYSTRKVYIRGNDEQISRAKNFFARKVEEDDDKPPMTPNGLLPVAARRRSPVPVDEDMEMDLPLDMDDLFTTGNNGILEVYVSAVETPEKFWIQLMGPSILSLDKLADEMTDFYENADNRRRCRLSEPSVGKIVAAPYEHDNRWYRAEIREVRVDDTSPRDTVLDVFYLDFGDCGTFRVTDVSELKEKFIKSLRFQAFECTLANIRPRTTWSQESIDFFREATTAGIWNTISAKIVEYKCPTEKNNKKCLPLPCVQLIDTTHPIYMDVAYELVKRNYAVWTDPDFVEEPAPAPA